MLHVNPGSFLLFSLDQNHIYHIRGGKLRYSHLEEDQVIFTAVDNPSELFKFDIQLLNSLNCAGEVRLEPYALMPAFARPVPLKENDAAFMAGLNSSDRDRLVYKLGCVRGFIELYDEGGVKKEATSTKASMSEICKRGAKYIEEDLGSPEVDLAWQLYERGEGPKPRTKGAIQILDAPSPRALLGWVRDFNRGGLKALLGDVHKRGNRNERFSPEENKFILEAIKEAWLFTGGHLKKISKVIQEVQGSYHTESERREKLGIPGFERDQRPGRNAIRNRMNALDRFMVLVAQKGRTVALKEVRAVANGVESLRPLQRVEMDEWKVDLLALVKESGLDQFFGEEFLAQMKLSENLHRWWLVAAIDCRTNVILGMTLTSNPKTSSALKCLRMVMTDKTAFGGNFGILSPWHMCGIPEVLVTDNGRAFKSLGFTTTCAEFGIANKYSILAAPGMRGKNERFFRTLSTGVFCDLPGGTFSNVVEKADYLASEMACLEVDDLARLLVRFVVDIYHNRPQEALYGLTPLEQWQKDMEEGNYPLHPLPGIEKKRLAFGFEAKRKLQRDGIRFLGIRYHCEKLHSHFLRHPSAKLKVRWYDEDLGEIAVFFDGAWQQIPSTSSVFKGMNATVWEKTLKSLRNRDPKRKAWAESIVRRTYADINEMVTQKKAAAGLLDHEWTEKRLESAERAAYGSIEAHSDEVPVASATDGFGRSVMPSAPKPAKAAEAAKTSSVAPNPPRKPGKSKAVKFKS